MPLSINVGLSRKASKDYQSSGTSINISAELDQSLLERPDELQQKISDLYHQAETALERRSAGTAPEPAATSRANTAKRGRNGNGQHPPATKAQRRAIDAIAKRLGLDAQAECRDELRLDLDELSIKEASRVIDHLKALQGAGSRNGGGR